MSAEAPRIHLHVEEPLPIDKFQYKYGMLHVFLNLLATFVMFKIHEHAAL